MTWEEYQKTREFMERKALALMDHEGKAMVKAGLPIENYTLYTIKERSFYGMKSNVFNAIVGDVLTKAHKSFPDKFGTGDAIDVLSALYEVEPFFEFEKYIEFLRDEQFAYVIELENGEVTDRILRIDTFRKIDTNERGKAEFTGGIFHALKHFSLNGKNLSTGNDVNDIGHPDYIIRLATEAFFITKGEFTSSTEYVSKIILNNKYDLKFVFYLEENSSVFFIKTIHKEAK